MGSSRSLLSALLLVTVGWLATPHAVPLYDGVGFPDQPYRYLTPAGQGGRPAPTGAAGQSPVSFGINTAGVHLATAELGPQAVVDLPAGSLVAKDGHVVKASVDPVAADVPPTGGALDGNVYRVALTSDAGPVTLSKEGSAYVYLRAGMLTDPLPFLAYRPTSTAPWQHLTTDRIGTDVFSAAVVGSGDYAAVAPPGAKAGSKGSATRLLLLGGGIALLLALGVLGLRRSAAKSEGGAADAAG